MFCAATWVKLEAEARDLLKRKSPIPRGHAWKPGSACKFWEREEPE
jgi:hypothetical protein